MTGIREDLQRRMEAAAEAMDFEEASRLRDRIAALSPPGGDEADIEAHTPRIRPQELGKMGLGSSEPRRVRPAGWTPPPRPDPMTRTVRGRTRKR